MEQEVDARELEDQDLADYDIGFQHGLDAKPFLSGQTEPWNRGWADARE